MVRRKVEGRKKTRLKGKMRVRRTRNEWETGIENNEEKKRNKNKDRNEDENEEKENTIYSKVGSVYSKEGRTTRKREECLK